MTVQFSVCIPILNDVEWLPGAIESVLAQTHDAWELVIGDSVSTDDIEGTVRRYDDPRVRYHRWTRQTSIHENHNRTIGLTQYEWVLPLGADDRLHPRCLERMAARITDVSERPHPRRLSLVAAACRRVDPEGQPAEAKFSRRHQVAAVADGLYGENEWLRAAAVPTPPWNIGSMAFSRQVLDESGGFTRPEMGLCADLEATLRMSAYGDVAYIDEPLLDYTVRGNSDRSPRFDRNRVRGEAETVGGKALLTALRVHEQRREVSAAEQASVLALVARSHLQRARHHRYLPGGHGRIGALLDVMRAARYSPHIMLSPRDLAEGLAAVLAPGMFWKWVQARLSPQR